MDGELPLRLQELMARWLPNLSRFVLPDEPMARVSCTLHLRYRVDPTLGLAEAELNAHIPQLVRVVRDIFGFNGWTDRAIMPPRVRRMRVAGLLADVEGSNPMGDS